MENKFLYIIILFLIVSCSKDDSSSGSASSGGENNVNSYPYKQSVGYSANDILSAVNFQEIEIDLMYVGGFMPEQNSINNVISFIEDRTYKTSVIVTPRLINDTNINSYTINNIRDIEDQNRELFTEGNKITISALFVNGSSANNNGNNVVLGTAYRNTSFVIYQETIQNLSNSPLETNRITLETSVILHELCHLLGLVNVGTDMVDNHQDTNHGAHCNVNSCLMYYALENGNTISNALSGNQIPQLDSFCIQDLQANGGR